MSAEEPAGTGIYVRAVHRPGAWLLEFGSVGIEIGDAKHRARWGETFYPLAPGVYDVAVSCRYLLARRMGLNKLTVEISSGVSVTIEWCAPRLITQPGQILRIK